MISNNCNVLYCTILFICIIYYVLMYYLYYVCECLDGVTIWICIVQCLHNSKWICNPQTYWQRWSLTTSHPKLETSPAVTRDSGLRADNSRGAAALCCVFTIINLMMHPLLGDKSPTFSKMQQTASQATIAKHVPCYRGACYNRNSYPI